MADHVDYYRTQSRWTDPGRWAPLLADIAYEPVALPDALARLLLNPFAAAMRGVEIPSAASDDRERRSVEAMRVLARIPARSG